MTFSKGNVNSHLRKREQVGTYSHLLVLLTAKTALTYVWPLQAVSQHSGLAQVVPCSTQGHTVAGSITLALIFILQFLNFYSLVFIVICDLFSLMFILITMSTSLRYIECE